jgi:hypothetical protein
LLDVVGETKSGRGIEIKRWRYLVAVDDSFIFLIGGA